MLIRLTMIFGLLFFHLPNPLHANLDLCEGERNQIAVGLAAVTIVGLTAGIVYLSSCHHGHCHSGCCSSYSGSCWSSYSDCYSSHHHRHCSSSYYTDYTDYTDYTISIDINDRINVNANPARSALTGTFTLPAMESSGHCHVTPFVKLPNGTMQSLGSFILNTNESEIYFGPFYEKGIYTFGLQKDSGDFSLAAGKKAAVTVNVNGAIDRKLDLSLNNLENSGYSAESSFELP